MEVEAIDNKKCYSCGKTFRTPANLALHKARKTPCLIRDISEENKKNPLRCIYCNKIFSKASNLTKHGKTCKIRNGGLDKLHDKVKHEEQMRIMKEEFEQKFSAQAEEISAQAAKMLAIEQEMEKLKAGAIVAAKPSTTNNTSINNGTINNINIIVNNYTNPNADHLLTFSKFNEIFCKEFAGLPVAIVCNLYFDQNHQENMSIHLVNKSTGEMLAMCEGNWKTMGIDEVSQKMRAVGYEIARKGIEMHKRDFKFGDAEYVCGNILKNVHHPGAAEIDLKEIKQKIVESREITGNAPHIAAKLEASRVVGRVRKGINKQKAVENTSDLIDAITADTPFTNGIPADNTDNIADSSDPNKPYSYLY